MLEEHWNSDIINKNLCIVKLSYNKTNIQIP